jgi:hypothetical protein
MRADDREHLLKDLDRAENVVLHVYAWVLLGVVVFVGLLLAGMFSDLPAGFGTQGEWFYLTIVLLLFVGWIVSQLTAIGQRLRPSSDAPAAVRVETPIIAADGRSFTLSLDGGLRPSDPASAGPGTSPTTISRSSGATSLPAEDQLDAEETARATVLLGAGHELDQVCRSLNPRYAVWDDARKELYRQYVQTMVDPRRA